MIDDFQNMDSFEKWRDHDTAQKVLKENEVLKTRIEALEADRLALRNEVEVLRAASDKLGFWMSAALDDDLVCDEMKQAINEWFVAFAINVRSEIHVHS